jgi:hypothetical protein
MQGMTIRIARIVMRRDTSGRTYWIYDRRGQPLGTAGGGASSSGESDPVWGAEKAGYVQTNDTRYLASLAATNTPSAGHMLYASGTSPTNLYFAPAPTGGSSAPSSIYTAWYSHDFNDAYQPSQAQFGTSVIYVVRQDYSNAVGYITTRLNMLVPAAISGDVWTVTHHAGPQTGTNVTFNVLYAITKGQATPASWTFTNAVTATWNASNLYDNAITHTLTNTIAGTNTVRLWISKGNSALGSGWWYWGDTTVEVSR